MAKQQRGRQRESLIPAEQLPPLTNETINNIVRMVDSGQLLEALLLLEALREEHPREAVLHKLLGMAYGEIGDLPGAVARWEEALELDPQDENLWRLLTGAYQAQGRLIHALRALRRYLSAAPNDEDRPQLEGLRDALEEAMRDLAATYGVTQAEAERGGLLLERGLRSMEQGDYLAAQRLFRDAARAMPGWQAPQNNLALCQFELGNFEQALTTSKQVLAADPDDNTGRAGLVRYLVLLGQRDEALPYADELWAQTEQALTEAAAADAAPTFFLFEQAAEAFTLLEQDERVVQALEKQPRERTSDQGLLLLAAALANLHRKGMAIEVLRELQPHPLAERLLTALTLNEVPPGGRFLALDPTYLLPPKIAERLDEELRQISALPTDEQLAAKEQFLTTNTTFLPAFSASLWLGDELASVNATGILLQLGTPVAIEAVRSFAFGRLGPDETRLHAALMLRRDGLLQTNRPLLLWQDGRYQEMSPPRYEIVADQPAKPYPPAVAKLMEKALDRRAKDDLPGAMRAYQQALDVDPQIAAAEQQLGLLSLMQHDPEGAERHLTRALEIDPDSVSVRTSLASLRISQGQREEARQLLIPLVDRTGFQSNDFALYLFIIAELAAADNDAARARQQLRLLLAYIPGYTPARMRLRALEEAAQGTTQPAAQQSNSGLILGGGGGSMPLLGPRG